MSTFSDRSQYFVAIWYLHSLCPTLKKEAAYPSETLITTCNAARYQNSENHDLTARHCENLNAYVLDIVVVIVVDICIVIIIFSIDILPIVRQFLRKEFSRIW
jgi:hypothetical protein